MASATACRTRGLSCFERATSLSTTAWSVSWSHSSVRSRSVSLRTASITASGLSPSQSTSSAATPFARAPSPDFIELLARDERFAPALEVVLHGREHRLRVALRRDPAALAVSVELEDALRLSDDRDVAVVRDEDV